MILLTYPVHAASLCVHAMMMLQNEQYITASCSSGQFSEVHSNEKHQNVCDEKQTISSRIWIIMICKVTCQLYKSLLLRWVMPCGNLPLWLLIYNNGVSQLQIMHEYVICNNYNCNLPAVQGTFWRCSSTSCSCEYILIQIIMLCNFWLILGYNYYALYHRKCHARYQNHTACLIDGELHKHVANLFHLPIGIE